MKFCICLFEVDSIKAIIILKHFPSVWFEELSNVSIEIFIVKFLNDVADCLQFLSNCGAVLRLQIDILDEGAEVVLSVFGEGV